MGSQFLILSQRRTDQCQFKAAGTISKKKLGCLTHSVLMAMVIVTGLMAVMIAVVLMAVMNATVFLMAVMIATVLVAVMIAMVCFSYVHCNWVVIESSQSVDFFTSWQHMNARFFSRS